MCNICAIFKISAFHIFKFLLACIIPFWNAKAHIGNSLSDPMAKLRYTPRICASEQSLNEKYLFYG